MFERAGWTVAIRRVWCFACHAGIAPGDRVYAPNTRDRWNVYCGTCGVKAEVALERKRVEMGLCAACGREK
jgi:hypothetical protein